MRIKKVYTDYNAERESKKLIHLKYYIRGRWSKPNRTSCAGFNIKASWLSVIERRKKCLDPITSQERRQSALSAIGVRLPDRNHKENI